MLENWLDAWGEPAVLTACGAAIGFAFGAFAQRSEFCLRASTVEVSDLKPGPRLSVWLLVFFSAVTLVQGAILFGILDVGEARSFTSRGSLSGAIIGGVLFGVGMILARGCASRLLVLSGTGNIRALITGLVLTLVAQASLSGGLSPVRLALARMWTIEGGSTRALNEVWGASIGVVFGVGVIGWLSAIVFSRLQSVSIDRVISAIGIGACVCLGWFATYRLSQVSFEPISISSITFTGPAADTLMGLVGATAIPLSFGVGLVPGVFVGSAVLSILTGQFRLQRFETDTGMERYLIGAALMGFGAMLAGGCAVGAGVSGGAILSITALVAVGCMWTGAMATHLVLKLPVFGH